MLTPALRVGEPDPTGPMDRTCVSTGRSPETSGPSSPECTDPQRWRPSRRQPPPRTGCPRARLLRPAGRHAMVVAHFFESGQRPPSTLGPSRERTANGRRSSAGQHRVHSCDRRKRPGRGTSARARASRVPHSVSRHCPRRQLESRVREAQGRVILLERGLDRQPSCGRRGQAVVRQRTPEELDDCSSLACYHSFTRPVLL